MNNYPITLNIKGRPVVVVGGGKIAYRKVKSLLKASANITIVAPTIIEKLLPFVESKKIEWIKDYFRPKYIENAPLIIAATNDRHVNEQVYEAKTETQWINIVDHPDLCDFHIPATVYRGKLMISVATSGASPLLARKIKHEIAEKYDESYIDYVDFLFEARLLIKEQIQNEDERKEIFAHLINMDHTNLPKMKQYLFSVIKKYND